MALSYLVRPLLFVFLTHAILRFQFERKGLTAGVVSGAKAFRHTFPITMLISMFGALLLAPFRVALTLSEAFVESSVPEVAMAIAIGSVVWDIPVRFVLVAAVSSMFFGRGRDTE